MKNKEDERIRRKVIEGGYEREEMSKRGTRKKQSTGNRERDVMKSKAGTIEKRGKKKGEYNKDDFGNGLLEKMEKGHFLRWCDEDSEGKNSGFKDSIKRRR